MTVDPHRDPTDAPTGTGAGHEEPTGPSDRAELSEEDGRLLDALSRPGPAVVRAVEDEPRRPWTPTSERGGPASATDLSPVFQAPEG